MPKPGDHDWPPHKSGKQWGKRYGGKVYYFGPLHDPASAYARLLQDRPAILEGRPRPSRVYKPDASTVRIAEVLIAFITIKGEEVDQAASANGPSMTTSLCAGIEKSISAVGYPN